VTYIAMLVPHHQAAVEMTNMAVAKATNPQVRQLATHIVDEQRGQINQMLTWLERRNAEPMPPPALSVNWSSRTWRCSKPRRGWTTT
jgi:uncharacterized protein (DUF305 family)